MKTLVLILLAACGTKQAPPENYTPGERLCYQATECGIVAEEGWGPCVNCMRWVATYLTRRGIDWQSYTSLIEQASCKDLSRAAEYVRFQECLDTLHLDPNIIYF